MSRLEKVKRKIWSPDYVTYEPKRIFPNESESLMTELGIMLYELMKGHARQGGIKDEK